jgi:hypothetical protein
VQNKANSSIADWGRPCSGTPALRPATSVLRRPIVQNKANCPRRGTEAVSAPGRRDGSGTCHCERSAAICPRCAAALRAPYAGRTRIALGSAFDLIFLRLSGRVAVDVYDLWTGAVQSGAPMAAFRRERRRSRRTLLTDSSCTSGGPCSRFRRPAQPVKREHAVGQVQELQ